MQTRTHTDRHGDRWTVHTGPIAREIRAEIHRDQAAALAHGDATGDYSRFSEIADTEAEVARRFAKQNRRAAA